MGLIGITNVFVSLSGLILLPVLTKNITLEDYGIFVQVNVTLSLTLIIATLGLTSAMVRFLAAMKEREEIREGFYTMASLLLFASAITSLILFLFSGQIAEFLFNKNLFVARIFSLIAFIECLNSLLLSFFRTFRQIGRFSAFSLTRTYLSVALVSYFVLSGYDIGSVLLGILISDLLTFMIMFFIVVSEIGIGIPEFKRAREYLAFGLPMVPGGLSAWVMNLSDRYIISAFLGTASVGYYSPGHTLGSLIRIFIEPLGLMLPVVLSKHYDEGKLSEVRIFLRYSLKYVLLLTIPSAFALSFLSKHVLTILSTREIASHGYLITPFIAASSVLMGAYGVFFQVIALNKKTRILGTIQIVAAIFNFGSNVIFIPRVGILGAAITTLLTHAIILALSSFYSFKLLRFDADLSSIPKSILASTAMSLVIIKWSPRGLLDIAVELIVCAAVYIAILLLLRGVRKEEVMFFKGLIGICFLAKKWGSGS
ncbi:MAG: oligosaccharide flippase family protein [Candidatus Korarchaeum sp.]